MKTRILIVDDEIDMLKLLSRSIPQHIDCEIETALSGEEAFRLVEQKPFDLALVDIRMSGMNGIELLERIKQLDQWLTVIMMTAHGAIEVAVESIKKGAYDFITKPFDHDHLIHLLQKALERSRLLRENLNLRERIREEETFQNFVGASLCMQKVYDTIQIISKTDVAVLITGDSGTGKNLAAKAIHALSHRSNKPYVRINCPTIPENILESELFGYTKGAFTNAVQTRKGLFEEADGGTIFLDEIGDISPSVQTKLLQISEDKEFKPLGCTKTMHVDVRIIASTNINLKVRMEENKFRRDLYYRLCVVDINMPPLRERKEDIPLLTEFFLKKYCAKFNRKNKQLSPELMGLFLDSDWNGNVRELENIIKKAVVMAPGDKVKVSDIGWDIASKQKGFSFKKEEDLLYRKAKQRVLQDFNINYATKALQKTGGNVTRAAQLCELKKQSSQQIMKKCNIKSAKFRKSARN
ncbi:MAG: sigma-54 dependent transcriptional regulator [Candidatus Desulfaltia sp.]|nr:sigma-54 dependent transcriptional regulator [Candidatus Desulfaltia sp.]